MSRGTSGCSVDAPIFTQLSRGAGGLSGGGGGGGAAHHKSRLCSYLEGMLLSLQDLGVHILPLLHDACQL